MPLIQPVGIEVAALAVRKGEGLWWGGGGRAHAARPRSTAYAQQGGLDAGAAFRILIHLPDGVATVTLAPLHLHAHNRRASSVIASPFAASMCGPQWVQSYRDLQTQKCEHESTIANPFPSPVLPAVGAVVPRPAAADQPVV